MGHKRVQGCPNTLKERINAISLSSTYILPVKSKIRIFVRSSTIFRGWEFEPTF